MKTLLAYIAADIYYYLLPLVLSMIAGYILGYLNQYMGSEGGPRTFALVTIGATLVTLVSNYFFLSLAQPWLADPGRISAQVVSALSFIGIGLIWLSEEKQSTGLASATNLWIASLFGLMLGSGCGWATMVAFTMIIVVYVLLDYLQYKNDLKKQIEAGKIPEKEGINEAKYAINKAVHKNRKPLSFLFFIILGHFLQILNKSIYANSMHLSTLLNCLKESSPSTDTLDAVLQEDFG